MASTYFGIIMLSDYNLLQYFVWFRIIDEGSIPEMILWYIVFSIIFKNGVSILAEVLVLYCKIQNASIILYVIHVTRSRKALFKTNYTIFKGLYKCKKKTIGTTAFNTDTKSFCFAWFQPSNRHTCKKEQKSIV